MFRTSCNAVFPHDGRALHLTPIPPRSCNCSRRDLFNDFPTLRFVIPHGGGAVPYHWGRYRGLAQDLKKPLLRIIF